MIVGLGRGQSQKGAVVDELTACQPKLAERLALGDEGSDGLIADLCTLVQVDFEDIRAVLGKCKDGIVLQLGTIVEFEL